jgi:hypothetical protein
MFIPVVVFGAILIFVGYLLIRRWFIKSELQTAIGPKFNPTFSYISSSVGISVDTASRKFCVAHPLQHVLLDASAVMDIRIRDSPQGGLSVDIALDCPATPLVQLITFFSKTPLALVARLKALQKEERDGDNIEVEAEQVGGQDAQHNLSRSSLQQELSALCSEISNLTAAITALNNTAQKWSGADKSKSSSNDSDEQ